MAPATSSRTRPARSPASRTRTTCGPTAIGSRTGPFIIIGLVRFTRCTVIEFFCRQTVTSSTPGPVTRTTGCSFVAHATALRSNLP